MSLYEYLELQPIELDENEDPGDLNYYKQDDVIDLTNDDLDEGLIEKWTQAEQELHGSQ